MKIRTDFITNSSSSSFIIFKRKLTPKQIDAIKNHIEYANRKKWKDPLGYSQHEPCDAWSLQKEDDDKLEFFTIVDNFNMEWFLRKLKIPPTEYTQDNY